ncbi:uncharacterized protein FPRN_10714 [Fusarium proliferatum]|nr:uncharacterized protein FPRN_10714 [Fusarium proliferatum]
MLPSLQGNHEYIYEERRCKRLDNLTKQSVVNVKIFTSDMIIWRGESSVPRATAQDVEPTAKTTSRDTSNTSHERYAPLHRIVHPHYARNVPLYAYIRTYHGVKLQS